MTLIFKALRGGGNGTITLSNIIGILIFQGGMSLLLFIFTFIIPLLCWYYSFSVAFAVLLMLAVMTFLPFGGSNNSNNNSNDFNDDENVDNGSWTHPRRLDWVVKNVAEYFALKVIVDDDNDKNDEINECNDVDENVKAVSSKNNSRHDFKQAIFAFEPHNVLPVTTVSFHKSLNASCNTECVGCITSAVFYLPFVKTVYTMMPAVSADRQSIVEMIKKGMSPVICPGGVREVMLLDSSKKECALFLKQRKGFVKLALEFGLPIVPVFSFGLQNCYSYCMVPDIYGILGMISRAIGFFPVIFFGLWNIPLGPPKPANIVNVIGKPIEVVQMANPTNAAIDKYHQLYLDSLTSLYDKYKSSNGMADIRLKIY